MPASLSSKNISLSALVGNDVFVPVDPNAYDLLETTILSSDTSSVSFTNLNSTYGTDYKHLQIRMTGRSSRSSEASDYYLRLNGDTGSNYAQHYLRGRSDGSIETANLQTSGSDGIRMYQVLTGATNTANSFGLNIFNILDAFDTGKNTTTRSLGGITGSTDRVLLQTGLWMDTAAITTITFQEYYGSNFVTGSRFSLYGIKAA